MKKLLLILTIFISLESYSQSILYLRGDTVQMYKQGGNANLKLMNATKDTLGALVGFGNGRTKFVSYRALRDSIGAGGVLAYPYTTNKYLNGYGSFVTLNTDSITEGSTNLFFTNAKARLALSVTTTGTSGAATYNNTTGVFNIPQYQAAGSYLTGADTVSLSNRINLKLFISDTASMLTGYVRGQRLTDTAAALRIKIQADSIVQRNAIALKLFISDTSSMLSPYLRGVGFSLTKSGQIVSFDSTAGGTGNGFRTRDYNDLRYYPLSGNPSGFLTGNQSITLSGDITGSGTTAITTTLATVNANVGTFTAPVMTVNAKGLVTAISNQSGELVEFRPTLFLYTGTAGYDVDLRLANNSRSIHVLGTTNNLGGMRFYAPLTTTSDLLIGYKFTFFDSRNNKSGQLTFQIYDLSTALFGISKTFPPALRIRTGIDASNGSRYFVEMGDSTTNWSDVTVNLEYIMAQQTDQARSGWYTTSQGVMLNAAYSGTKLIDTVLAANGTIVTADNGLTANTATNVRLGGTLLANTTIDAGGSYQLLVQGSAGFSPLKGYATAVNGIQGETAGANYAGIYGNTSNANSYGIWGYNSGGGLAGYFAVPSSDSNSVLPVVRLRRQSTTGNANGLGASIDIQLSTAPSGNLINATRLISRITDSAFATATSHTDIAGYDNGSAETFMNIQPSGVVRVNNLADTLSTKAYVRSISGVTTRDRFGFSGEDATAGENRLFNGNNYTFNLDSASTLSMSSKSSVASGRGRLLVSDGGSFLKQESYNQANTGAVNVNPVSAQLAVTGTGYTSEIVVAPRTVTINPQDSLLITPGAITFSASARLKTLAIDSVTGKIYRQTVSGGSGVNTMAAIGASPNANGATISGSTLTLQPADSSFGGVVTTSNQFLNGFKTFTDTIAAPGIKLYDPVNSLYAKIEYSDIQFQFKRSYDNVRADLDINALTSTKAYALPDATGIIVVSRNETITSSATVTPVGTNRDNVQDITALATNVTIAAPSGTAVNHNMLLIRIKDNATARTITFNAIYRAGTQLALPTTTTISKTMYLQFIYNSADTKWDFVGYTDGI